MNTTTMTTVVGVSKAVLGAVMDYLMHNPMDGGAFKQPTFWIGLVIASLFGVQGFLTQGIDKPAVATAAAQPEAPKA